MITYDKESLEMEMTCNSKDCDEVSIFRGMFRECISEAKHEGWAIIRREFGFDHFCPQCSNHGVSPEEVF